MTSHFVSVIGVQQALACFALHALWQVSLLVGAAWAAIAIGKPPARIMHRLWCGSLLLCVLLPAASTALATATAIRVKRERAEVKLDVLPYAGALPAFQRAGPWMRFLHRHTAQHDGFQPLAFTLSPAWARRVASAYLLVTLVFAVRLGVSWWRTRRIVRRSSATGVPHALLGRLPERCAKLKIGAPPCRLSSEIRGPALAGVLHPVLLIPQTVCAFPDSEVDAVLAHELAHLRRRDPRLQAVCAWLLLPVSFHPIALWLGSRIRHTREMACDAEAAKEFGSATGYAQALLRIAESALPTPPNWSMPGMFHTGLLGMYNTHGTMEKRMQMLMNGNKRVIRGRTVRLAGSAIVAAASILAAGMLQVQPALAGERAFAPNALASQVAPSSGTDRRSDTAADGDPSPSSEHAREQLRGAQHQLAEAQRSAATDGERTRITNARSIVSAAQQALAAAESSAALHVDLLPDTSRVDVPTDKEVSAMSAKQLDIVEHLQSPFSSPEFKAEIDRAMQHAHTLTREQNNMVEDLRFGEMHRRLQEQARQLAHMSFPGLPFIAPAEGQPLKIAAGVLASNSLHKESPLYPAEAKQKAIQGAVVLHVLVDETGKVEQVSMLTSPDPALTDSAVAAVKQWTYKPFLLNGNAVPVESTVTVTYSLAK